MSPSERKYGADSPLLAVAADIVLLFLFYTVARVEFLLENRSIFAGAIADGSMWRLLAAGLRFDTPAIFYTNAPWLLLMLLPLHLKERPAYYKAMKWLFVVVNSIMLAISLADSVYFPFTLRRTSAEIFSEFSNEGNLGGIFLVECVRHWYLLILLALMIRGLWKLYVTPRAVERPGNLGRYYALASGSLIIAGMTAVGGMRGGLLNHWYNYLAALALIYMAWRLWRGKPRSARRACAGVCAGGAIALLAAAPVGGLTHRDIRPISLSNAAAYTRRPVETALVLNTPFSVIRSFGKTVFSDPGYYASEAELDAVYTPVHPADSTAVATGRNIVVLIVESFGREYIGEFSRETIGPAYRGYAQFTDSLIRHSATWRFSYSNGRKSIDGMPSVLAGIPMFIKPFILTPQALDKVEGLPAHLRRIGYSTAFFHGARTGSMGFDAFANSIGFERYHGREDFNRDKRFGGDSDFDGYWAIWDEPFLQYMALQLTEMKQPFMAACFTASSHHPFRVPEQYQERFNDPGLPIYKCIRYTDNALRRFFDTARTQPWYRNTIFVITSDHTSQSAYPQFKSGTGTFSAPLIIFDPSGSIPAGRRDAIAQQTDIMPTLLKAAGYGEPFVAYGIDLLDTPAADTWAVNYFNGTYQYMERGLVMQFDGQKATGLYELNDWELKQDLLSRRPADAARMERRLKGIIQSYMQRLTHDRLTVR